MKKKLSKADIKYLRKMLNQLNNYDDNTIEKIFKNINKSIDNMSDEELNNLYKEYCINADNNFNEMKKPKVIEGNLKNKLAKYKDYIVKLYEKVSKKLYKSDKNVIKTLLEIAFVYFLFLLYSINIVSPAISLGKMLNVMCLSISVYVICRLINRKGREEDLKLCNFVEKTSMLFLKASIFLGLGDFAFKYLMVKNIYATFKMIYVKTKSLLKPSYS